MTIIDDYDFEISPGANAKDQMGLVRAMLNMQFQETHEVTLLERAAPPFSIGADYELLHLVLDMFGYPPESENDTDEGFFTREGLVILFHVVVIENGQIDRFIHFLIGKEDIPYGWNNEDELEDLLYPQTTPKTTP